MSRLFRNARLLLPLVALALLAQACGLFRPASPAPSATEAPLQPSPVALPTDAPATALPALPTRPPLATETLTPTSTSPAVSITAVNGDLAIRTGPDAVFDAVATLKSGHSLPVYARSIQDGWLQVPIPSQRGALGWVSTKTGYSQVDGYVLDLPLITVVEWPFGAWLVNCTSHQLLAQPGDKPVPAAAAGSASRTWFYPGLYTLYDADVAGKPVVTQVKLFEHTTVRVISDGTGAKYACP